MDLERLIQIERTDARKLQKQEARRRLFARAGGGPADAWFEYAFHVVHEYAFPGSTGVKKRSALFDMIQREIDSEGPRRRMHHKHLLKQMQEGTTYFAGGAAEMLCRSMSMSDLQSACTDLMSTDRTVRRRTRAKGQKVRCRAPKKSKKTPKKRKKAQKSPAPRRKKSKESISFSSLP